MQRSSSKIGAELIFLLIVALVAAISLYGGAALPSPVFERIGSGAFPFALGIATLALVAVKAAILVIGVRQRRFGEKPGGSDGPVLQWQRHGRALAMLVLTAAYLWILSQSLVDFRVSTSAYLFLSFCLLGGRLSIRKVLVMLAASVVLAVAMDFVFRHLFYVDL
ncbi:tripartite tricarboxylate transporter TctB family protein [Aurantimonas sp. VKM B-3413]|uniref:tripartite tricarboxylate transporter TctB family protein n=1 Tax=Aurantimonas sp. VKM B-3413 TaxID=2779401 RepID=UPI001E39B63D|nr:tripartite tricarboxylate transporter TctB family protein [Aurantimonas sp. VKM B-3413]MCB8840539.1 tripartite tricarboxylate transporter TctB family protein [Aurantimonas sp. VKM B-3413]